MFDFGNLKEPNGYQALLDELVKRVYAEVLVEDARAEDGPTVENAVSEAGTALEEGDAQLPSKKDKIL